MKKTFFLNSLLISISLLMLTFACAQDKIVDYEQASPEIKAYISKHFTDYKVVQYEIDVEGFNKKHEIFFANGTKLEFDSKNQIVEISGKSKIPDSTIPDKILKYVEINYPNNFITEWELDGKNQQIGMNNDLDLVFSMNGDFIYIDD